jgi:hypothetical protein
MLEFPIKTKLLIFSNSIKNELSLFISNLNVIKNKTESERVVFDLAKDIVSIPFFLGKDRNDEYEWLISLICYNFLTNPSIDDNNVHLNIISQWDSLDYENRNAYFLQINYNRTMLSKAYSIQDLIKLKSQGKLSDNDTINLTHKIEFLLLKLADFIVSVKNNVSQSDNEKIVNLKNIIISSKHLQIELNIKEYLNNQLKEIGYDIKKQNLNITNPDEIRDLILKNQDKISGVDKKYILEFLMIQKYLKNQIHLIYSSIEILNLQVEADAIDTWIDVIKNQIGAYNAIYLNTVTLIVCLCENELVLFYELYQTFEGLGIFKTNYEKEVLESLVSISSNINNLNNNIVHKLMLIEIQLKSISKGIHELNSTMQENIMAINNLEESIFSSFESLETVVGRNFNQLSQNITGHLSKIESGIEYNNLVSTVSTYQLYKINKQTKPLLPPK